ncbi:unnamed protein product [Candidula unifasciata]|uniref:Pre-mRNA-splicing regulator WTAP n=1 Tax=Candidula unifasciata TaxID=100452 RepID=A0A8S3ZBE1_9EUPU|nr:unnamed protein product [Candidula unifasciata]
MSESSSPKRPRMDFDDGSGKEDHHDKYKNRDREIDDQTCYPQSKHQRKRSDQDDDDGKEEEVKAKPINIETARREHTLVMRLTNKEQELQDCMNQIQEMKQAQTQNTAQLRSMLLDPAINLVFQRMAKEMDEHKEKLKQKQNELSAWKFTPDSQIGKRMMARCRLLLQENADLGKMISSGRTARLESEIVMHKALVTEMKKNQKELDEFVGELEEDVEGMQGMIFMLQQQLKEAHEQIARLQQDNERFRTLRMPPDTEPGGSFGVSSNSNTPLHNWTEDHGRESELGSLTPGQLLSSAQAGKNAENENSSESLTKRTSPALPPALLALSVKNKACVASSDQLSIGQNCEDDFSSFAYKVTPDSGMQTQEDEDVSMDAPEYSESVNQQQVCDTHLHQTYSHPHVASRTTPENPGITIKREIIAPQAGYERTSISQTSYTPPHKTGFPHDAAGETLRTTTPSTKSSQNSSDSSSKSLQALSEGSASTENASCPFIVHSRAEGEQRTQYPEETMDSENRNSGRTNHTLETRYEKTSAVSAVENKIGERPYGEIMLDENKAALHATLGLHNVKIEDDKPDIQLKIGLVNGSPVAGQGL